VQRDLGFVGNLHVAVVGDVDVDLVGEVVDHPRDLAVGLEQIFGDALVVVAVGAGEGSERHGKDEGKESQVNPGKAVAKPRARLYLEPMRCWQRTTICRLGGLALGVLMGTTGLAHTPKQGDIWATVGPFAYQERTDGIGLVAEGDVDMNGGVEIGLFYLDKTYKRAQESDRIAERIKRMYITTGYRHWFVPWLSAGLSIASSYSMGDPKVVSDERPSGLERTTSAREITEYGFDTSLLWEIWSNEAFGVVADVRYQRSLTRKSHEDADVVVFLLGFKYLVPKRGT
jgi:hypothetical protein